VGEFCQQQAISPVASRENQAHSAVTGALGYGPYDRTGFARSFYHWKGKFLFLLMN